MNGIILFAPALAALGAFATLRLFTQARDAAETKRACARVPVRRRRSR